MYIANYIFICILGVHITLLFCSSMGSKRMNNEFVCAINYRVQTKFITIILSCFFMQLRYLSLPLIFAYSRIQSLLCIEYYYNYASRCENIVHVWTEV